MKLAIFDWNLIETFRQMIHRFPAQITADEGREINTHGFD
jgi:hypothetical protein